MTTLRKKERYTFYAFIGILGVFFGFSSTIVSGNPLPLIISMSTVLVILFLVENASISGNLISYGTVFNGMWYLYTVIPLCETYLDKTSYGEYDIQLFFLSLLSMLCFNVIFIFFGNNHGQDIMGSTEVDTDKYNLKRMRFFVLCILLLAISAQIYVIVLRIGLSTYIYSTRAARSILVAPYRRYMFFEELLILVAVISYYLKTIRKSFLINLMFYIALIDSLFISIVTISRTNLLGLLLPILFLAAYKKRVSNSKVVVILAATILLFAFWKTLFSGLIFNQVLNIDSGNFMGEFNSWYTIGNNVLRDLNGQSMNYLFGSSYVDTLVNMLLPFNSSEALSVWYVRTYEYQTYLAGGGRGFSSIVEAYMNYPIIGNIVYFSILGTLFATLEKKRNTDAKFLMIYSVSLPYIQRIFRSESYSFFKTWWWFYVIPILVLFALCRKSSQKRFNGGSRRL